MLDNYPYTFEDYKEALDGVGPKIKEVILERATHDHNINLVELKALVEFADAQ